MTTELASATELRRGLYVKMAVGSNVETDSNSSVRPQSTFHKQDGENCFGLPYEDHNYGASPLTLSSHSAYIPRQINGENCFNKIVSNSSNMCVTPNPSMKSRYVEPNLHRQNGLLRADDLPLQKMLFPNNNIPLDTNAAVGDVTRCICGFKHDDGYMISCDRCAVWQHIDCVNIDRNNIPDTYLCDVCNPRSLNKEEAMRLQAKRMKELSTMCELNSSEIDSGDEKERRSVTYTAVQSTPTSLTITSNRSFSKKRKRSKDDNKRAGKKAHMQDRKRSRSTSKSSCADSVDDDHVGTFTWSKNLKEWAESYHPIDENLYTAELLQAVLSSSHRPNETVQQKIPSVISQLHKQLMKVQQLRNRVIAMEDIPIFRPVVEVLGSYMLSKQAEIANSAVHKRPYPYVSFYNGFDGLDIVVDSRTCGNISRYARRSCCPNCEVRHVTDDNKIHLFIYSKENIQKGSEITIPFDFKYQNCLYNVECGCGQFKDCPVYKFTNMRMEREQANATKQSKNRDDEFGKVSPLRLPLSRIHEHTNGYPSTDPESSNLAGGHDEDHQQENQRKKSREDRKMEAYIRAFERMEKQMKKKEQLHHTNSYEGKNHLIASVNSTAAHTSHTTTTTQSVTTASEEAPTTPVTAVTPQRRFNRRRSTKSGRKNSRRGRGASFEGVMSPTAFIDNTSSHSLESSSLMDSTNLNSDSLQWLPPLTIEPSIDSNLSMDTSLTHNQPEIPSNLPNPDPCVQATDLPVPDEKPKQIIPEDDKSETIKDTSVALPLDVGDTNTVELPISEVKKDLEVPTAKDEDKLSEPPPTDTQQSSSATTKPAKKKSSNSAENLPATVSKSDPTNTSRDFTNCPFQHWDYRPGVPNGQVHIGVRLQKGRKYLNSVYIKKNWLDMAKHEDLIPTSYSPAPGPVIGFKKRLLQTFSKANTFSAAETSAKPELLANHSTNPSTEVEPTSPASVDAMFQTQQNDSSQSAGNINSANEAGNDVLPAGTTALLGVVDRPSPVESTEHPPAIQYENISDDEASSVRSDSPVETLSEEVSKGLPQQEILSAITPTMNGNISAYDSSLSAFKPGDDNISKAVAVAASTTEENKNAPTKKKVSLQEYWKRSKGSRKSSVEQTQHPVNAKVPINPSPHARTVLSSPGVLAKSAGVASLISSKPKDEATAAAESKTSIAEPNDLTNKVSSAAAQTTLSSENLHLVESTKKPPVLPPDSSRKNVGEVLTKPDRIRSCRTSAAEIGVSKPSSTSESLNNSLAFRPHVERSFSSPNIRLTCQSQSDSTPAATVIDKKSAASLQNSPAHVTGSSTKGFASPVSASPRSSRCQSASFAAQSPTAGPYKHRQRLEHSIEGPSIERARSRHGSSASSGSNSTPSNKSPKQPVTEGGSLYSSSGSQCLDSKPNGPRREDSPQKVQSLTPAVPGQPIPSLMRGPGNSRIPQVVYNRRPSPRMDGGSPLWEAPRESSARSLKDIPYAKHDAYHQPSRSRSPLVHTDYDRAKKTAEQHYYDRDRYLHRPSRREDGHTPVAANPPDPYYHPLPYYSQGYRSDRPSYPPRSYRPSSPGPPLRHNPEYYSKTNNHRPSNYYPQDIHRR